MAKEGSWDSLVWWEVKKIKALGILNWGLAEYSDTGTQQETGKPKKQG